MLAPRRQPSRRPRARYAATALTAAGRERHGPRTDKSRGVAWDAHSLRRNL